MAVAQSSDRRTDLSTETLPRSQAATVIERHAGDLLELLAEEDLLDAPSLSELDLDGRQLGDLAGDGSGALAVTFERPDAGLDRRLFVSKEIDEGTLNVFVSREREAAHAALVTDEETTIYHTDDGNDVAPATHCDDRCTYELCSEHPTPILYREIREPDARNNCYVAELQCNCSCC